MSPTATRSHGPTPTPAPLPKAETVTQAGAPNLPLELQVPFVGGSWPVGVFVLDSHEGPSSKKAGFKTLSVELGVLNEAGQPLTIAAAGQYKEAVSLYTEGHWKGLFFVAFRTSGGQDLLPADGGGAADLPPGVWGQMHLEIDLAQDEPPPQLRAGVQHDNMPALALSALTLKPQGQPWAAAGAAPTPVIVTATPMGGAALTSKPTA
ncbi:MAG: hypothetical protein ACHQ7M_08540 [Chloroflexota bacterium]